MMARTFASVFPRQSPSDWIFSSMRAEADATAPGFFMETPTLPPCDVSSLATFVAKFLDVTDLGPRAFDLLIGELQHIAGVNQFPISLQPRDGTLNFRRRCRGFASEERREALRFQLDDGSENFGELLDAHHDARVDFVGHGHVRRSATNYWSTRRRASARTNVL